MMLLLWRREEVPAGLEGKRRRRPLLQHRMKAYMVASIGFAATSSLFFFMFLSLRVSDNSLSLSLNLINNQI